MAYGIKVKNSTGNVIISNEYPVFQQRATASRGHDVLNGSIYWFNMLGDLAPTADRILMLKPNVGQWIAFDAYDGTSKLGFSSNQNTISGVILDDPKNLTDPSFGVLVRSDSGVTRWQSDRATAYITDGEFQPRTTFDPLYTRTFTGCNAGAVSGGGILAYFSNNRIDSLVMERTATNTIKFSYKTTYPGGGNTGQSGSVAYVADIFMLVGRIT